jgi:hypothetical protein
MGTSTEIESMTRAVRPSPPQPDQPSIAEAVTHVVDAGERLVSHRLELAIVELRQTIESAGRIAGLVVLAALLAGCGWIFAMIALFAWLEPLLGSRAGSAAAVGGLQLALAGVLFALRRRRDAAP